MIAVNPSWSTKAAAIIVLAVASCSISDDGPPASTDRGADAERSLLILAHRGGAGSLPESTQVAYLISTMVGVDYLEADLQLTSDGVIVVTHDDDLVRTSNIAEVFPDRQRDPVSSFTFEELLQLEFGGGFRSRNAGIAQVTFEEPVLTLEDVIAVAAASDHDRRPGLYLETKSPEKSPGIERRLREVLDETGFDRKRVVVQTFSRESLDRLRDELPNVRRTLLLWVGDGHCEDASLRSVEPWLDFAVSRGAHAVGLSFDGDENDYADMLTPEILAACAERELEVHVYTAVTRADYERVRAFGPPVTGVFLDDLDVPDHLAPFAEEP